MRRGEVSADEWTIPTNFYKIEREVIPLSAFAQAVPAAVPKIGKALFFTT